VKNIIIGFSSPSEWMIGAEIIKWWQDTPYCHVYLRVFSPWAGEDVIFQASHGHVHNISAEAFLSGNTVYSEFRYDMSDSQFRSVYKYLIDTLQRPYSYLGLLEIACSKVLKLHGDGSKGFVCSELAGRAFPEFLTKPADLITPADLYAVLSASPKVQKVSNG
jgi:hypothetical protein